MDTIIFLIIAFMYGLLLLYFVRKLKFNLSSILLLVIIALIYDNLIISIGKFIGEGDLLETLNIARFWLHALFTPTLIIFSYAILRESKIAWAQSTITTITTILLTCVAIIAELFAIRNLEISATFEYGALSYSSTSEQIHLPIMMVLVILALLITAIVFIKRFKWWWILNGLIVMGISSAVPIQIHSNALTNISEFILILTLVFTKKRVDLGISRE